MTFPLKQNYKYLILKAQILKKVNDLRLKKKKNPTYLRLYTVKKRASKHLTLCSNI